MDIHCPSRAEDYGMDVALDLFGSEIFFANEIELAANVNDATDGLFESGSAVCSGYNAVAIPRSIHAIRRQFLTDCREAD